MIDVGQTIGNYDITARLGEGGMGTVFLAVHPVIGSKVALKAIHPELSRNAEVVSRFIAEAKSVNQIGHEHIVDIADFGTTPGGEFYFIMEYLQGEALSDRLKREGRLDPTRSTPRTRRGSSTGISSPRTSSFVTEVRTATSSRCSTSAWPS